MKQINRRESGMALMTVLSMGLIMSIWAYALSALVIPAFTKAAQAKHGNILRSGCEATLDWCANTLFTTNTALDDAVADGTPTVTYLTAAQIAAIPLPTGVSASISVNRATPPSTTFLYDSTMPVGSSWRQVTVSSWYTARPLITKRVSIILKPLVTAVVSDVVTTTTSQVNPFTFAAFGKAGVNQNGHPNTDSVSTSGAGGTLNSGGDIGSIGVVNLGSGSSIGGNVKSYSPNGAAAASGTNTVIGSNNHVYGSVSSYGGVSNLTAGSGTSQVNNQAGSGQNPTGAINTYGADNTFSNVLTAPTIPPTPTAPATATNLGAVSLSGKSTMTLAPGDYVVSSLSIAGNASLILSGTSPVNIYVQGAGSTISIGGNGISNTSGQSKNMRIWYSGTSEVSIAGNGALTGVIYAPNATVKNNGNGAVTGSVVGNYINMNGNAPYHFDRDLLTSQITLSATTTAIVSSSVATQTGYQTVSWREN